MNCWNDLKYFLKIYNTPGQKQTLSVLLLMPSSGLLRWSSQPGRSEESREQLEAGAPPPEAGVGAEVHQTWPGPGAQTRQSVAEVRPAQQSRIVAAEQCPVFAAEQS